MNPALGVIGLIGLAVLGPGQAPAATSLAASRQDGAGSAVGSAVSVASAAVPLAVAAASLQQIGTSPATPAVDQAPRAVSVTFDGALDPDGASMKIFGPSGEVSAAQPQVDANAVRRPLDKSVPAGTYVVRWKALGQDGEKLAGSFTFIAEHGSGTYAPVPVPSSTATAAATPGSAPASSAASPTATAASTAVQPAPSAGTTQPPQTGASVVAGGSRGTGHAERISAAGGSLPGGWMVVPVVLGALLILASAAVGRASGARARARSRRAGAGETVVGGAEARVPLFVYRGLTLPGQRHQS